MPWNQRRIFREQGTCQVKLLLTIAAILMAQGTQAATDPKWESCAPCHEDIVAAFSRNRHAGAKKGCDSCHGGSAKHAETGDAAEISNPKKVAPKSSEATCMGCHKNHPSQVGQVRSGHGRGQVACVSCHSVHTPPTLQTATSKNQQCFGCHAEARAQFARPFSHKLTEGQLNCVDCHNPHGSFNGRALATAQRHGSNEPGCLKCHTDKRGPFRFEHAPVRFEACNSCHEPHGSVNPRMLVRQDVATQCMECHSNLPINAATRQVQGVLPPAFHDIRDPFYRNCTTCHTKIHGSHVSKSLLK